TEAAPDAAERAVDEQQGSLVVQLRPVARGEVVTGPGQVVGSDRAQPVWPVGLLPVEGDLLGDEFARLLEEREGEHREHLLAEDGDDAPVCACAGEVGEGGVGWADHPGYPVGVQVSAAGRQRGGWIDVL